MRVAILSDVHGNLEALEAIVEDAEKNEVEEFYCLGDIVGYGADPSSCVNFIRALGCRCVKGNHDAVACGFESQMNLVARQAIDWTITQLTGEQLGWLSSLPLTLGFDENTVLVHGSLYNVDYYHYILEQDIVRLNFMIQAEYELDTCFLGHSHLECGIMQNKGEDGYTPILNYANEKTVKLDDGHRYIFNPGSVGQPRGSSWKTHYAMVEMERSGKVHEVTLKRVKYDILKAANKIISAGLPPYLAYRLLSEWESE